MSLQQRLQHPSAAKQPNADGESRFVKKHSCSSGHNVNVNVRVVSDRNILLAISESWDKDAAVIGSPPAAENNNNNTVYNNDNEDVVDLKPLQRLVSPGLQYPDVKWTKIPLSSLSSLTRSPQSIWERFAFLFIHDSRDVPIFNCAILASLTLWPSALYMFFLVFRWWWGLAHVVMTILQTGTFTLAMHVSAHRPIWKYSIMQCWIPLLLAPFFGQTVYTYYFHHIKMHHVMDNNRGDCSSTLLYQRDNPWHFMHYFFRFYFLISYDLPMYFWNSKQHSRAITTAACEIGSLLLGLLFAKLNFWPTIVCFVLPFNLIRIGMMSGNWVQHSFLEPTDPLGGGLKNSITVVDSHYNAIAFNDGYHASHHLNPRRHWSEHPLEFFKKRHLYFKEKAVVFRKYDYWGIFFLLMRGRYDLLADVWVHIGPPDAAPTKDQVIQLLREKTRQFKNHEIASFEKLKAP